MDAATCFEFWPHDFGSVTFSSVKQERQLHPLHMCGEPDDTHTALGTVPQVYCSLYSLIFTEY